MAYRHLRNHFQNAERFLATACLPSPLELGQDVLADAIPTRGYDADANDKPTKYIPESHIPAGGSGVMPLPYLGVGLGA